LYWTQGGDVLQRAKTGGVAVSRSDEREGPLYLVGSGPLPTAVLAHGRMAGNKSEAAGGEEFCREANSSQDPHWKGVLGQRLAGGGGFELDSCPQALLEAAAKREGDFFLVVAYD
jgi:hypothetical protein